MQSFLQYRRIGRQLQRQLDRHNAKLHDSNDSSTQSTPDGVPADEDFRDVEKARQAEQGNHAPETANTTPNGPTEQRRNSDASSLREEVEDIDYAEGQRGGNLGQHLTRGRSHASGTHSLTSQTSSRRRSLRRMGTTLGARLTGIDVRDRTTKEGGNRDEQVFVVGFEGDDDLTNPHNWSYTKRAGATVLVALIGIIVGIASSIDSEVLMPAAQEFGVAPVTESLATGIYLIGFGFGSLFVAPFSETFGRNPIYVSTLVLFAIWVMASALAPNIGAQLAFRFLAGLFGSTPLTCAGGSIADMWNPMERTLAFPVFANAAFTGPLLGPVMGGFIAQSSVVSWRWAEWTTLIGTGVVLTLVFFLMPETFSGILLSWKAKHLREITGDQRYRAPLDVADETFFQKMKRSVLRPFIMTSQELIIIFISLYLTVIYIILFTFLDGYSYIFGQIHGTSDGITGLCFVGIIIGLFLASGIVWPVWRITKRSLAKAQAAGKTRLPPETRLWTAMLGGSIAIPVSLFWMAWTSYPGISIWSPLAASVLFGYGILCVFITSYQYVIDSYEVYSASALAFVTVIRYVAAGGMVVVGIPFYENLGVHYTLTILACISAVVAPLPYVFYKFGPAVRRRSKYAVSDD